MTTSTQSLKDDLAATLPDGFECRVRYVRSSPKPCGALFSPMQGDEPEKTRLASHFLTVSTTPKGATEDTLFLGIEALVYTTRHLTTIFVSKADSTGYLPQQRPSPVRVIATTFLKFLASKEQSKHPSRKLVISLFARSQSQYLFPGSADNTGKHVLDDRQLIKWWARVLDPIIPKPDEAQSPWPIPDVEFEGYITIPGYSSTELRSFMPPSSNYWRAGDPLFQLARTRGISRAAPPRCLLPRFPDDPKARFMQDLDNEMGIAEDAVAFASPSKRKTGKWKSVRDLARFWEAMEFRQECSSGRMVGFLWLVIRSKYSEDDDEVSPPASPSRGMSQNSVSAIGTASASSPTKKRRKVLTGAIIPRQPRLKGGSSSLSSTSDLTTMFSTATSDGLVLSKDGYDKAMQKLLHLNFSNLKASAESTSRWASEVSGICGIKNDWSLEVIGTAKTVANEVNGGAPQVNDLGGMIRKKRKVEDQATTAQAEEVKPAVNVLGAGTIRKKSKPNTT